MTCADSNLNIRALIELSAQHPVDPETLQGLIQSTEFPDRALGMFVRNQIMKMTDEEIGSLMKDRVKRHVLAHGNDEQKFVIRKTVPNR